MSSNSTPSTFLPGGIASLNNRDLRLAPPYIFIILLASLLILLLILLIIREIFKSRGILRDFCSCKGGGVRCLGCQECCATCAESCDCCESTSLESCFGACCPKRGSLEVADIVTCEACCQGTCCTFGNSNCNCAPANNNANLLCCGCENQYDMEDDN